MQPGCGRKVPLHAVLPRPKRLILPPQEASLSNPAMANCNGIMEGLEHDDGGQASLRSAHAMVYSPEATGLTTLGGCGRGPSEPPVEGGSPLERRRRRFHVIRIQHGGRLGSCVPQRHNVGPMVSFGSTCTACFALPTLLSTRCMSRRGRYMRLGTCPATALMSIDRKFRIVIAHVLWRISGLFPSGDGSSEGTTG